jgi:hypothetical protein
VEDHVLESLDSDLAECLVDTLEQMTAMLEYKKGKGLDVEIWERQNKRVFYMLMRCMGVYNNYKLINKQEPE